MVQRLRPTDEPEDPTERKRFWEELVVGNQPLCGWRRSYAMDEDFTQLDEPGIQDTPEFWEWLIELREAMWCGLIGGCDESLLADEGYYDDWDEPW